MVAPTDKKSMRAQALACRERVTPDEAKAASLAFAAQVRPLVAGKVVAGYRPVRGELDVTEALTQLAVEGHEICLPVAVADQPLSFRRWQPGHALVAGMFGIGVPLESEPELHPDTIIVPLVAFDAAGHRLGYGAGYYDRTIRKMRDGKKEIRIIGAAFACQKVEAIAAEVHDERLDAVVTEREVIRLI